MEIQIIGHESFEVTDPIKDYVHDRFKKLSRHSNKIHKIEVTLSSNRKDHRPQYEAKAIFHLPMKGEVVAKSSTDDTYTSIDALADKLDRQLNKYKEKTTSKRRRPS
jgi:putative sigma-54 modulation protein